MKIVMKNKIYVSSLFTKIFIFIGVLGTLIPIPLMPSSFRVYYLFLPITLIYFIVTGIRKSAIKYILLGFPLIIYSVLSASLNYLNNDFIQSNENPIFRFIILFLLFVSTILIAFYVNHKNIDYKFNLIKTYLKGYFVTLIFGYVFFIGYYKGFISINIIEHFQVQVQEGYGLLRMSPGSYPNEYGNVSSFVLSIITLFLFYKKGLKRQNIIFCKKRDTFFMIFFWIITLIALFLTTTRSAYISYIFALIYIILSQKGIFRKIKSMVKIIVLALILFEIVQNYVYDIKSIFLTAYLAFFDKQASAYTRITAWQTGLEEFKNHYILGVGFGSLGDMHNVYLQILFEMGLLGTFVLLVTFFIYMRVQHINKSNHILETLDSKYELLLKIKNLAILHVLWFATNNHNLNHHLTWFCVLLILISNFKLKYNSLSRIHKRIRLAWGNKKIRVVCGNKN